ncbi:MAG: TonB-dependent receptor plug domain-containing protein [Gemmatimonas sp.]|nr:TonB-dependent receptor plug domain-containing protein [Gemmatimonas sp.]
MRSDFAFAVTLALFAGWIPARGLAQQGAITVSGTVRTEEGRPVPGVTVVAEGAVRRAAVTDGGGAYRLGPIPGGRYVVTVQGLGYGVGEREIEAPGAPVDFVLERAPIAIEGLQVVAATRTGAAAATLPVKVEVIPEQEVLLQRGLSANPTEILSNLIPSFSPARQKLSTAGESFRGRRPLFLVDGVPQSNPLRDGRRDGFTIDMEAIERVEVIFGANAIQGLGATGGIINYVTVAPAVSGELEQRASLNTTSGDAFEGDGIGWRAHYLASKRFGRFDVLGSIGYEQRGLQFDGEDRPIAVDNVQGDVADSRSRNLLAKIGWEPTATQRMQLMVNDFRIAQDGNFEIVAGDRSTGTPAVSIPGHPEGIEPINDVTTASLDYENTAFGGGTFSAKAYLQDFSALYGGDRFETFQDPQIAPVGELFDQSENNSEKYGARLTYSRAGVAGAPVDVITGFDFLRDRTVQRLALTDRNWVPATEFYNYAPFLQLDLRALGWLSVSGGLRWELAELDVSDFTTLAGNRPDHQTVPVAGGSPGFDEPLLNLGGVITPLEGLRFYGTFSQAFTMPDVGRVLRGVSSEGTRVDDFLALQPIATDNLEIGGTFGTATALLGVTYFESESDFGSRLVPNADGIFQVMREPTKTSGWEVSSRLEPAAFLSLSAGYSLLRGSFDGDDDGAFESDLSAADIGPDRLNLSADIGRGGRLSGRVQSFTYFDRTFRDGDGSVSAEFDGYTTIDASVAVALGISTITFSISNLLDEQYITYFGQAATDLEDRYFAGRGRTLTLGIATRF